MLTSLMLVLVLSFWNVDTQSAVQWAVEFKKDVDIQSLVTSMVSMPGVIYEGPVGILSHVHLFKINNLQKRSFVHQNFVKFLEGSQEKRSNSHPVVWYAEQKPLKREKRSFVITDPLYAEQWHLHGDSNSPYHLNVEPAWDKGYLGYGVRIAVVDDGIETDHPDLIDNVYLDSSWNFNLDINSPNPTYLLGTDGDWHGTASAGAAAGRNDGSACGVGVAPHAQLAGIAILQNNVDVTDAIEAKALAYKIDKNFIYSNSWGPLRPGVDGHGNEAPGPLAYSAIQRAIREGRGGLGSVYVWAAGNDGTYGDNCNYDGYANMRYAVLIGSTEENGLKGSYSEPCAALLGVTPGGTISSRARITTTDLTGRSGKSAGNCTTFAGTSASCPLTAGLIALMLEANPALTWLDVQYVLAKSARKHNDDTGWFQNGAGKWVNHKYGWGLLDADKAVSAARDFNGPVEEFAWSGTNDQSYMIAESGASSPIICPHAMHVHHVEVNVWTTHPSVSTVRIVLRSPSGSESVLAEKHNDYYSRWEGWRFLSRLHFGEDSKGEWTLIVTDDGDANSLTKWKITLYGNARTINN